jgi:hypothetical protein
VAWRTAQENPFMTAAERAAAPLLGDLPERRPDEPGQFAFGEGDRVLRILDDSGWSQVDIAPIDVPCSMPEQDLARYVTRMGPVGRALRAADDATRAEVATAMRAAFDDYVRGSEVQFVGACWLVRARA